MERKGTKSLRLFAHVVGWLVAGCMFGAILGLISNRANAADLSEPPLYSHDNFNYACEYVQFMYGIVDCSLMLPPVIITSRILSDDFHGLHYVGESYIFVNKKHWLHDKPLWNVAVVHETVHYVLEHANRDVDRCESEEIARRAHHLFEGSVYNSTWEEGYRCA